RAARTLFHPGSAVRARARRAGSPILYGYPEITTIFRGNDPLFAVAPRDSAMLVLQYGTALPKHEPDGPIMGLPDVDERIALDSPGGHPGAAPAARADDASPDSSGEAGAEKKG